MVFTVPAALPEWNASTSVAAHSKATNRPENATRPWGADNAVVTRTFLRLAVTSPSVPICRARKSEVITVHPVL